MSDEEIKNNPSLRKLRHDAEGFRRFGKAWPILRPVARLLGVNTEDIDRALAETVGLGTQVDEMTAIPDKFNSMFSDKGWVLFGSMELEAAQQAIEIAENEGIEEADEFLVQHFSPDWVESHLNLLKHIEGFRERFDLAELALQDYRASRYYASILVTLSLIDGWVGHMNIVDFHRRGFFSEESQLVAWDSIAAHPKGLVRLQRVFGKPRMKTRTEEIRIPFRHGIVHGMDLGYNNRHVAAKCWAALFAVRDWVIKAAQGELSPPELEPEVQKTLWESIEGFRRVRAETEQLRRWRPRRVVLGESVPPTGQAQDYPPNTPEQKIVEFLNYWLGGNYGYMARCYAPMLQISPAGVRERFEGRQLLDFELMEISDVAPNTTDVKVRLSVMMDSGDSNQVWEFRLIASTEDGDLVHIPSADSLWGITTWRITQ